MKKKVFEMIFLIVIWGTVLVVAFILLFNSMSPTQKEIEIHKKEMIESILLPLPDPIPIINDELPAKSR